MRRRTFIAALGGAAVRQLTARAQHSDRMRRIGVLMSNAENDPEGRVELGHGSTFAFTVPVKVETQVGHR